jgi:hypothetical protein
MLLSLFALKYSLKILPNTVLSYVPHSCTLVIDPDVQHVSFASGAEGWLLHFFVIIFCSLMIKLTVPNTVPVYQS